MNNVKVESKEEPQENPDFLGRIQKLLPTATGVGTGFFVSSYLTEKYEEEHGGEEGYEDTKKIIAGGKMIGGLVISGLVAPKMSGIAKEFVEGAGFGVFTSGLGDAIEIWT